MRKTGEDDARLSHHELREKLVAKKHPEILMQFQSLKDACRNARYSSYCYYSPEDVEKTYIGKYLEEIKSYCLKNKKS